MSNDRKLFACLALFVALSCYIFAAAAAELPPAIAPASENEPQPGCHSGSDCGGHPDDDDDHGNDDDDDEDDDSCWWAIVLGVVGGVALIVIAIVAFVLIRKRKAIHSASEAAETENKAYQKSEQAEDAKKSDPPPAYQNSEKDHAKVHDVTGQAEMPPPYTIQLPPYNPAQNVYIYMDKMTAPAAAVSHQ